MQDGKALTFMGVMAMKLYFSVAILLAFWAVVGCEDKPKEAHQVRLELSGEGVGDLSASVRHRLVFLLAEESEDSELMEYVDMIERELNSRYAK